MQSHSKLQILQISEREITGLEESEDEQCDKEDENGACVKGEEDEKCVEGADAPDSSVDVRKCSTVNSVDISTAGESNEKKDLEETVTEDDEEAGPLQLAWEVLEVARAVCDRYVLPLNLSVS